MQTFDFGLAAAFLIHGIPRLSPRGVVPFQFPDGPEADAIARSYDTGSLTGRLQPFNDKVRALITEAKQARPRG